MKIYGNKVINTKLRMPAWAVNTNNLWYLQDEEKFDNIFKDGQAGIYIIVKRPCLVFKELKISNNGETISGKIHQPFTEREVFFSLNFFQKNLVDGNIRDLFLVFCENKSIDETIYFSKDNLSEKNAIDVILIKEGDKETMLQMMTPDLLLRQHYRNTWSFIEIDDYSKFLEFDVLYVGEAAKNKDGILSRLKSHEKIQSILMSEYPYQSGMLLTKEIIVMIFEIQNTLTINREYSINNSDEKVLNNKRAVPKKNIYLDAEKAFINFFPTNLNQGKLYKKYPKSDDGIANYEYENILYSITDPIKLKFGEKYFRGSVDWRSRDYLLATTKQRGIKKISIREGQTDDIDQEILNFIEILNDKL